MARMTDVVPQLLPVEEPAEIPQHPDSKAPVINQSGAPMHDTTLSGEADSENLQRGVKEAEAVAAAWSKKALIASYAGYAPFLALNVHLPYPASLWRCHWMLI